MGGVDEFAAALSRAATAIEADGARKAAEAAAKAFLAELKRNTPVLTGALMESERVDSVWGAGSSGGASISTHRPEYASFREHGGTIHVRNAKVLTDGFTFFGKSVTQSGSHYMARTVTWADGGGLDGPVSGAIQAILRDAGL